MIIAPYRTDKPYDIGLEKVVATVKRTILEKDDDFFIICTATRGAGKTTLMFHFYEEYAGVSNASVAQVALTRPDFARAIKTAKDMKLHRFVGYDEANVSKRDALTKWNRAVMDLYYSIRGLQMFHWWNNPSAEMLDKPFIEECVKGLIFIFTKDIKRPRLYYYFTKDDLLDLLEKHGNLKHRTLKKYAKQYAYYRGWFKDYNGPLKTAYLAKKMDRMEQKVDDFHTEYGLEDGKTIAAYSKSSGISESTGKTIYLYGVESGLLQEGEHFARNKLGKPIFTQKGIDQLDYIVTNKLHTGRGRGFGVSGGPQPNIRRAVKDPRQSGVRR